MGSVITVKKSWFNIYAAAIFELDTAKIADRITSAQTAIAERVAQLEAGDVAETREPKDLVDALNKLQILISLSQNASTSNPALSPLHLPEPQVQPLDASV